MLKDLEKYYKEMEELEELPPEVNVAKVDEKLGRKPYYSTIDYLKHPYQVVLEIFLESKIMFCFQFRKEFTPQLYTSLNRQGLGCSRLTHKTLKTFSEASDFITN